MAPSSSSPTPPSGRPTPPPVPAGRHCCVGITRFNQAMLRRGAAPRCAGVHVIVQDAAGQVGSAAGQQAGPASRLPAEKQATPPAEDDWRFTCYGFSEWTSTGTADGAAPMPRCRFGYRPPHELTHADTAPAARGAPERSSRSDPPPERANAPAWPGSQDKTDRDISPQGWERAQERFVAVGDRWVHAGSALYTATGRTATKLASREWNRDATRLQVAMSKTASRGGAVAAAAADTVLRRLSGN